MLLSIPARSTPNVPTAAFGASATGAGFSGEQAASSAAVDATSSSDMRMRSPLGSILTVKMMASRFPWRDAEVNEAARKRVHDTFAGYKITTNQSYSARQAR